MPDLSDADKTFIRAKSGDLCTPPAVSDALLQVYFDAAGGSRSKTIVSVLEDLWAKVKAGASRVTDFGTSVDTSEMDHIEDLLTYWRAQAASESRPAILMRKPVSEAQSCD